MTIAEAIMQRVKVLPESIQTEVLDFVEYLGAKKEIRQSEEMDWCALSLSQAMRGMETENSPYQTNDLKRPLAATKFINGGRTCGEPISERLGPASPSKLLRKSVICLNGTI